MRRWLIPVLVTISVAPAAGADRTRAAAVPLSIDGKGGIVVDVRVNGAGPFKFILDTGTARTVVADALARELGAPVVATSEVVTITGSDRRLVVRLDSIAVSPVKVDGVLAPLVPASELAALGRGVRGLLGQDFLSAFNYTLDYRHARLTWDQAGACSAPGAVRMQAAEGRFSMVLTGEGGASLRVVPDSGAEVAVLFRAHGPHAGEAGVTRLRSLQIGEVTLRNLDAYIVERADPDADGLLPLHGFSSVSFAAGGACLIARK
jgi:predicted aspartyl protease